MSKQKACILVMAVFTVLAATAVSLPAESRSLNLIVITIDTLRADHVGAYGYKDIETPHIDGLAQEGVVFFKAFTPAPLTLPAHCTLFTGKLPLAHMVRDNGFRVPKSDRTLAEIAGKNGYATAAFIGAFPLDSRFGLDRGFDVYDDHYGSRVVPEMAFLERRADQVNKNAVEWISDNSHRPFFAWIHYFDPHAPYDPPSPFAEEYNRRPYDGEIAYTDHVLGKLLEALDQAGLRKNTLIILTSDHGEGLGEHGERTHGIFIYDSTMRVPLIISLPNILPQGLEIDSQVGLVDIMPTILDFLGWEAPPGLQGRSLVPMISGAEPPSQAPLYMESMAPLLGRNWASLQAIRTDEWKYIDAPIEELYDLKNDSGETINVIEEHPGQAGRLRRILNTMIEEKSSPLLEQQAGREIDADTKRKLSSLGYIRGGGAHKTSEEKPDPKTMITLNNLFNDAVKASESGHPEKANDLFEKILRQQPDFVIGYEYAAHNLHSMGRIQEAIRLLEKAVEEDFATGAILSRLGIYYQEAGRLEESLRVLNKALTINPHDAEAHNHLGVSLYQSGRIEDAVSAFQKALSLDKSYAMAMNNLANCHLALKRIDQAMVEYEKAIEVDERLASAHNGLAVVFYRKGRAGEALKFWEKSVELDPSQAEPFYNLGRVHLQQGDKKKALRFLELYLQKAGSQPHLDDIEEVKEVVERLKKELKNDLRLNNLI